VSQSISHGKIGISKRNSNGSFEIGTPNGVTKVQ